MIQKILFSQPRPETAHNPYTRLEEQFNVQCEFHQFIHIEGLTAKEFRQQHINPLDYTAVILNSKLGAEHYFRMCEEMRLNVPDSMHYYCNSEQVGLYLQKFINYRKRKVFFPETGNKFEDILPAMHRRPNEKYLMVLSDIHNRDVINMFAENHIEVQPAIMYRTVTTISSRSLLRLESLPCERISPIGNRHKRSLLLLEKGLCGRSMRRDTASI